MSTPLESWVEESARLTKPSKIVWCDGSRLKTARLAAEMLRDGTFVELNPKTYPHCTFIAAIPTSSPHRKHHVHLHSAKADAGPTNNWMAPDEAKEKVRPLFDGAMKGRTMYVVPYILGPSDRLTAGSASKSPTLAYVAPACASCRAWASPRSTVWQSDDFVPGLHSLGDLDPKRRFILHFPEEKLIWSIGSGYGGNALLGKKCFALRIASWMAREQGWMAEHMSSSGWKIPPAKSRIWLPLSQRLRQNQSGNDGLALENQGYRVWTVGDDIAWITWALTALCAPSIPKRDFSASLPAPTRKTNPNVIEALRNNSIFTNIGHHRCWRALVGRHRRRAAPRA